MKRLEDYFESKGIKKCNTVYDLSERIETTTVIFPALKMLSDKLSEYGYISKIMTVKKSINPDCHDIEFLIDRAQKTICNYVVSLKKEDELLFVIGKFSLSDNLYDDLGLPQETKLKKSIVNVTKEDIIEDFISVFIENDVISRIYNK